MISGLNGFYTDYKNSIITCTVYQVIFRISCTIYQVIFCISCTIYRVIFGINYTFTPFPISAKGCMIKKINSL